MRRVIRTFGWPDTKWLCQKSVIRSVSGERVTVISSIHHARSARPSRTCVWTNALRSSGALSLRGGRNGDVSVADAGGGDAATVRVSRSSLSTAASRVIPA